MRSARVGGLRICGERLPNRSVVGCLVRHLVALAVRMPPVLRVRGLPAHPPREQQSRITVNTAAARLDAESLCVEPS